MIINDQFGSSADKIALIGEAMVEVSRLDFSAGTSRIGFAGDTLNTAIYLRRALGTPERGCDYLTVLGEDALSDEMVTFIDAQGLGTTQIGRTPSRGPALYAIHVDGAGERRFQYWRDASAARLLFQTDTPTLAQLSDYPVIYLSAITLAILPDAVRGDVIARCAALKAAGHVVVFDSNYRPALWASDDVARQAIADMWAATTLALPSHDDEQMLYPDEPAEETLARLVAAGVSEVALKRGAQGPLVWAQGKVQRASYPAATQVVDTTAAGDSFNAAYLAARIEGTTPLEAAQAGHALAARVIGKPGAIVSLD